jgi:hypothetical protein
MSGEVAMPSSSALDISLNERHDEIRRARLAFS